MSQENVDLLRRITDALNRDDFEGAIALADPPAEFEFVPSGVLIPDLADVQRGPEGFRKLIEFVGEFDDRRIELHELIDAPGDRGFGAGTLRGRGKQSGVETNWDIWSVWTVRDGRLVHWQGFTDRDPALEAAGLRE